MLIRYTFNASSRLWIIRNQNSHAVRSQCWNSRHRTPLNKRNTSEKQIVRINSERSNHLASHANNTNRIKHTSYIVDMYTASRAFFWSHFAGMKKRNAWSEMEGYKPLKSYYFGYTYIPRISSIPAVRERKDESHPHTERTSISQSILKF